MDEKVEIEQAVERGQSLAQVEEQFSQCAWLTSSMEPLGTGGCRRTEFVVAPAPWPDTAHPPLKRTGDFRLGIYIRTGIVYE